MQFYVDKQKAAVVAVIIAVIAVPLVVWQFQGWAKRDDLRQALLQGRVERFPPYLQGKHWTAQDAATVGAKKLVFRDGYRRSLAAALQDLNTPGVSGLQYSYVGWAVDTSTGMKYLFALPRNGSTWQWAGIHPDSHELWLEVVRQETEKMNGKRVPEDYVPYRDALGPTD